LQNLSTVSI